MRSKDFITWAATPAFPTRIIESAPAFFRRVSWGVVSVSPALYFSWPAIVIFKAAAAFSRPFILDSPQGLFTNIDPGRCDLNTVCAYFNIP